MAIPTKNALPLATHLKEEIAGVKMTEIHTGYLQQGP